MPIVLRGATPLAAPLQSTPRHIPVRYPRSRRAPSQTPAGLRRPPLGRPHSWGSPADLPLAACSGRSQPRNRYTLTFPSSVIQSAIFVVLPVLACPARTDQGAKRRISLPRQHSILLDFCPKCLTTTRQQRDKNRSARKIRAIILHPPLVSNWRSGFAGSMATSHESPTHHHLFFLSACAPSRSGRL
jgi:hypothetical protein